MFQKEHAMKTDILLKGMTNIYDEKAKKLGLEVLQNSDLELLQFIIKDVDRFTNVLVEEGVKKGTRWDDLAFYFEWTFEVEKIKNDQNLDLNVAELVTDSNYRCTFDYETIVQWHRDDVETQATGAKPKSNLERMDSLK
jgi:hypothetical protein